MSKRHWLRDEIDFTEKPHNKGPYESCDDRCLPCNRAAQEIADSLALYDMPLNERTDAIAIDPVSIDHMAKNECCGFYRHC